MRNITKLFALALLTIMLACVVQEAKAQVGTCTSALGEAYLDVNNVRARIFNNGNLFWRGSPHVYEVPIGGGAQAIFTSGVWIGGYVGGQLRVAAARYGSYHFWAGPLDDNGAPPSDCSEFDHLYKVSATDILEYEATGVTAPDLRDWPTGLGAPTYAPPGNGVDDDGDGEVDEEGEQVFLLDQPLAQRIDRVIDLAGGERPAILGDQSIWWVMNDRGNEHRGAASPPIGLEVHVMAFAFKTAGDIGNSTFYKYDFYYKGTEAFTDVHMAIFSDPDLGNYQDDWVASDTSLGMGIVWNSDNDDQGGDGYGTPAPAAGYDFFQGPIVPSPGDTANVSGTAVPDFRNLPMTSFTFYNNGGGVTEDPSTAMDHYNYTRGRWKDGKCITLGGNGRDFSEDCTSFMFPGDMGYSDEQCQYWSECNSDGAGTDIEAADRRFVMGTGPFTINPGDFQQIVYGLVWARGQDNFDSVQKLKQADVLAQAAYDINFELPSPPNAPNVTATALDQQVILEWSNSPQSNNFLESYSAADPFAPLDNNIYDFEGYEVIQYENALDQIGQTIAVYDVPNGVQRVIDGIPGEPTGVTAQGTDRGVQTFHTSSGLTNYSEYYFGVQAYAYNDASLPKIFRGPVTRLTVVPTKPINVLSDAALAALEANEEPDFAAEKVGIGDGSAWANVVNPGRIQDASYTLEFYEVDLGGGASLSVHEEEDGLVDPVFDEATGKSAGVDEVVTTYDIKRDGAVVFDGSGLEAPQRPNVVVIDGLNFSVVGPVSGFKDFQTVANAAGPLDPPEYFAYSFNNSGFPDPGGHVVATRGRQQSTNNSAWGFHAGGAGIPFGPANAGGTFLNRAMRGGGNFVNFGIYDFEMRFTQRCVDGVNGTVEPTDCLGYRAFGQAAPLEVEVPFELWRTGISTPDDMSDDVRLVPIVCESLCGAGTDEHVYDIGGDHAISGGANDPFTDWVYWYVPEDLTPGEAGHNAFWAGTGDLIGEAMARTVLVQWNGGTAPPYDVPMLETGTVIRILSNKPNQPGDVYTINTAGYGVTAPDLATQQARLDDIGIVPNPYSGHSSYEVSQLTDEVRFTNLPDVATIRIFTLNGTLIKTIEKQSVGVATISWNLATDHNLPIASGLYLIHVEVPNVGETTFKFAVVKKRIQLNVY